MLKKRLPTSLAILLLAAPVLPAQTLAVAQGQTPSQEPAMVAEPAMTQEPALDEEPLTPQEAAKERTQVVPRARAVEKAQPVDQQSEPSQGSGVPLRNGDTVEIRIANVPPEDQGQFTALYTLDEGGMVNLPFIGLIKAGGLAPSQVQIAIQNKLIADGIYTNPTVTVNPPAGARFITVSGAVRAPGRVPYSSDLTLMTTIDSAGGPSDFAGDKIRLVRAGKIIYFSRKKLHKDPSQDPSVSPGDQIEIEQSPF